MIKGPHLAFVWDGFAAGVEVSLPRTLNSMKFRVQTTAGGEGIFAGDSRKDRLKQL